MRYSRAAPVLTAAMLLLGCASTNSQPNSEPDTSFETAVPITGAFDLQAHRGGLGLVTESTIESFVNALELGVSTLELDTQITEDGVAVVTHDRQISEDKCVDTAPATAGDPEFPYVGKYMNTLTLAQVRTVDCGSLPQQDYPQQRRIPGARMPTLTEVLELVQSFDAPDVMLNVETKVEAGSPDETAPREQFVAVVLATIRDEGMLDRVTIQSFDWGALMLVRDAEPEVPVVALTNGDFLQTGEAGGSPPGAEPAERLSPPGAEPAERLSPWLGGIDVDDFGGDGVAAAASFGASAYSPVQGTPQSGTIADPDFELFVTQDMVDAAHERGIRVVPWTVDDPDTMRTLMDLGVDGIITDYPDRLREVMAERGLPLPPPATRR